jgi:hypothetical protein
MLGTAIDAQTPTKREPDGVEERNEGSAAAWIMGGMVRLVLVALASSTASAWRAGFCGAPTTSTAQTEERYHSTCQTRSLTLRVFQSTG